MAMNTREHAARQLLGLYESPKPLSARNTSYDPVGNDAKLNFVQQYVLNRASALSTHSLDGDGAAREAFQTWCRIKQQMVDEL